MAIPTTQAGSWGNYTHSVTLRDSVVEYLNEFAEEYDVDAIVCGYRDATLKGIVLCGDDFFVDYPADPEVGDLIRAAIAEVELNAIADRCAY